ATLPAAGQFPAVRLNTIGYRPADDKAATVRADEGTPFEIVRAADGAVVLRGALTAGQFDRDRDERVAVAEYSSLREPGEYRLQVAGLEASPPFRIAEDVYAEPFRVAVQGMTLWRCGTAVAAEHGGDRFAHEACHLEDALLDPAGEGDQRRSAVGGWHDAGDYNKYVVNAGATVGVMLRAWEDFGPAIARVALDVPDAPTGLPAYLAEVKWELDWLLRMQADDGSAYHKISTRQFGPLEQLPEEEKEPRYFVPGGTTAAASLTAMLAQAARVLEPYDAAYAERCRQAARKGYEYLSAHPEYRPAPQQGFSTGAYESPDADDRLWAAAEVWAAAGDAAALVELEARLRDEIRPSRARVRRSRQRPGYAVDVDWDWGNVKNLGLLTYLLAEREGRDPALVEQVRDSLVEAADAIVAEAERHPHARPLGDRYYWGCNGSVARQAVVLAAASRATGDSAYRAAIAHSLGHLFGRNPFGRSYVTGLGHRPPLHPHDRRSAGDAVEAPWPGYLVGGPNPGPLDWHDDVQDYRTNEIAINWNAALIYALASQLPE
ncbi:MAG TPA: glycoside hydrolase family 9 protein, partial [Lacipirellulaceae bacterium]|nr:glycoside hydrolase family 9 protein [Lacipirellulaceae bacterium]